MTRGTEEQGERKYTLSFRKARKLPRVTELMGTRAGIHTEAPVTPHSQVPQVQWSNPS